MNPYLKLIARQNILLCLTFIMSATIQNKNKNIRLALSTKI